MADRLTLAFPRSANLPQGSNQPVFRRLEIEHVSFEPIEFGSSYFPVCACGYVGPACLTRVEALRARCDVEDSLLRSAELLGHILASSDERRSVLRHE